MKDIANKRVIADLADLGYGVARNVVPTQLLNRFRQFAETQIETLKQEIQNELGVSLDCGDAMRKLEKQIQTDDDLASNPQIPQLLRGVLPTKLRLDSLWLEIVEVDAFVHLIELTLDDVAPRFHMPPMIRFKWPNVSTAEVPWHQDFAYNLFAPNFLNFWIPFVPVDQECGGGYCHSPLTQSGTI